MFFDNFDRYCKQLGKTNSEVTKAIGLDPSSCTGWRNGSVPRNSTLKKLADYFGITVEELMGAKKEPAGTGELDDVKKQVVELMDDMSQEEIDAFLTLLKSKAKK